MSSCPRCFEDNICTVNSLWSNIILRIYMSASSGFSASVSSTNGAKVMFFAETLLAGVIYLQYHNLLRKKINVLHRKLI